MCGVCIFLVFICVLRVCCVGSGQYTLGACMFVVCMHVVCMCVVCCECVWCVYVWRVCVWRVCVLCMSQYNVGREQLPNFIHNVPISVLMFMFSVRFKLLIFTSNVCCNLLSSVAIFPFNLSNLTTKMIALF